MSIRIRTLAIVVLLGAVAAGLFVYSGIYNVSATEQHTGPVYRLLDFAMQRSVRLRAAGIEVPGLDDRQRTQHGLVLYRKHCIQCHGAPGVAPDAFAMGMMPVPASLVATAREWGAADIFWTVRHGIKMSGMPAWQYRLSDEEIWDIVAFVKQLAILSPKEYAALSREAQEKPPEAPAPAAVSAPEASLGDPQAGAKALQQYMCVSCHRIPGIAGAYRHVGPPLDGIGARTYIAGVLPNTPANMIHWIRNPTTVAPLTAMPDMGVSDRDARDIAAYLYTLKDIE